MDNCLKKGYELSIPGQPEKYTIIDVIGRGASTIAYSVRTESGVEHILKEYCPQNLRLERDLSGSLLCSSQDCEKFERGKQEFLAAGNRQKEIRNILRLRNETSPSLGIYEANNTQYSIIIASAGETFNRLGNKLPLLTKIQICCAIAKLVSQYHQRGYLCLDIKPDNIFVLTNSSGEIVTEIIEYIDFDSIRQKGELSFGRSISHTRNWSAPEQTTPYGYSKICEATDVYTIGELVFWSVFDRHSFDNEHRDYSTYPFEEVTNPDSRKALSRTVVQNDLTQLFHSTLRPAPSNRFQTMNELVQLLKKLITELDKKEYVIESAIRPKDFFVGRADELRQIDDALHKHGIVFVSGIAGIGKSELVKQYICNHKKEYDNILYWVYDGDIDNMVARESTVRISGLSRIPEENDSQYAKRLLDKANELTCSDNNLIVIDNLNQQIDKLPQEGTWERIKRLHGKLLITTRISENQYHSIAIDTLTNSDDLFRLFRKFCPFSNEELGSVHDIINLVDRHTLLVELLAHLTKASHANPSQTLEKLRNSGISGLSNEAVRLCKDNKESSDSVHEHIKSIFSMESISENCALILAMLAFLPVEGVTASKFKLFYSIENYDNLNWLILHGWVSSIYKSDDEIFRIHPTVATVVAEYLKTKETLCNTFFARSCDAINIRKSEQTPDSEQILFADSLALSVTSRHHIECRSAALFLEQYVEQYSQFGNLELKLTQADFATRVLEANSDKSKYSAVLEEGYYLQASILYTLQQYDRVIPICENHLVQAKEVKDIYFAAKWCLLLQYSNSKLGNNLKMLRYSCSAINYVKKNISRNYRNLCSSNSIGKLDYDYLEKEKLHISDNLELLMANLSDNTLSSANLIFSSRSKTEANFIKLLFRQNNKLRKSIEDRRRLQNSDNILMVKLNEAKIAFLSSRYPDTEKILQELSAFCNEKGFSDTQTIYQIHQFLAQIALWNGSQKYETALSEFERCMEISKTLQSCNVYGDQIELGYLYIVCGGNKLEKAEAINTELLEKTKNLAPEIRKTYYADVLRNMGYLHYVQGNHAEALNMLYGALLEYNHAIAPYNFVLFGQARTFMHLADCMPEDAAAMSWLRMATSSFDNCVGPDYSEAKACLSRLEELRARQ